MTLRWTETDLMAFEGGGDARTKKAPVQREWKAQEIDWAFLMKALPYGACAYGIDQAAKRSRQANAARLRRGCKPGVGDTYIFWNKITLWLERKAGSSLSTDQAIFRDVVLANGGHWALVECTEDIEIACGAAGIPLRATVGGIRERIEAQDARLLKKPRRKSAPRNAEPRFQGGKRFTARARQAGLL